MGKLQVTLQYKPWLLHCLTEIAGLSPNVDLLPSKNVMGLRWKCMRYSMYIVWLTLYLQSHLQTWYTRAQDWLSWPNM